ncbi:MAG: hypothetical protein FAZ92_02737 [Accumulibacter sp.]|nr:MAG: hypothetical protein FAZ92_02737 [Accumulibacter sp.]
MPDSAGGLRVSETSLVMPSLLLLPVSLASETAGVATVVSRVIVGGVPTTVVDKPPESVAVIDTLIGPSTSELRLAA